MLPSSRPRERNEGLFWLVLLRVPEILLGILVAALVVFLTFSVFARYVLDIGLVWSDEAARLLFVWTVFIGFAVGLRHRGNIGVELLIDRLPPAWRHRVVVLQDVAILAFSVIFTWQSAVIAKFSLVQRLPALQVSIGWLYFAVLVAGVLMTIYAVANLRESLKSGPVEADARGAEAAHRFE